MLLSNSGRVIIIDDEISEARPLMEALGKQSIPYLYYDGQPHNLPDTPPEGVRFVFLDIALKGMSSQNDKSKVSTLIGVLKRIISDNNGPYVIVFWTTHHDVIDLVIEKCREISIQPVEWLNLEKSECINSRDGTYDLEFIKDRLENKLKDVNVFQFYNEWENIITQATKDFIYDIASCFEVNETWNTNTEFLIYKLYKTFSSHGDDFSNHEKLQSAFHLLNRSFLDKLELLTRDISTNHMEFFDHREIPSSFHDKYLRDDKVVSNQYSITEDKTRYILNKEINLKNKKKVLNKINDVINYTVIGDDNIAKINKALFISENKRKDIPGAIFLADDKTMKKIILEDALKKPADVEVKLCFVLLTPECDITNSKHIVHRAVYGVMSADLGDKEINNGEQYFKIGPFWHEEKIQNIIINFQTVSTIHLEHLESYDLHISLKRDLFFDLQSKASNHVNRLGNYQLS